MNEGLSIWTCAELCARQRGYRKEKNRGGLPYKWTNNSKTNEHFKGQIQWVMGTDRNLAWFGMQGSDTSKNECMESRSVKRWDLRKEHSWQQELHMPTPEMKKNSAHYWDHCGWARVKGRAITQGLLVLVMELDFSLRAVRSHWLVESYGVP